MQRFTYGAILGMALMSPAAGQIHDLETYGMTKPAAGWVEDGVAVTPESGVINHGDVSEHNVPVHLLVISDEYDTVYVDTAEIAEINPGDSVTIEFAEWTPEGACEDWSRGWYSDSVGVYYSIISFTELSADDTPDNDTTDTNVICLLSNDVAATEMVDANGNAWGGKYPSGTSFDIVVTVENFGCQPVEELDVDLTIMDTGAEPDTIHWHNVQIIEFLDWRGNDDGNLYIVEVEYPTWTITSENYYTLEVRTLLTGDDCSYNDETFRDMRPGGLHENIHEHPFSLTASGSHITFSIVEQSEVSIHIFDSNGRLVKSLIDERYKAGTHTLIWDGSDDNGREVSAGIYLIKMQAGKFDKTVKTVIID